MNKLNLILLFQDRKGKTLLSHAIEANNLELVKLLVTQGKAKIDIRVREDGDVSIKLSDNHLTLSFSSGYSMAQSTQ